jgi:hypothetical protein
MVLALELLLERIALEVPVHLVVGRMGGMGNAKGKEQQMMQNPKYQVPEQLAAFFELQLPLVGIVC